MYKLFYLCYIIRFKKLKNVFLISLLFNLNNFFSVPDDQNSRHALWTGEGPAWPPGANAIKLFLRPRFIRISWSVSLFGPD